MIDIKALRKGQRIIRHWLEGDTKTSDFIIISVLQDPEKGWIAYADWCDDDYSTTIYEEDQYKYHYGRRWKDLKPRQHKETVGVDNSSGKDKTIETSFVVSDGRLFIKDIKEIK